MRDQTRATAEASDAQRRARLLHAASAMFLRYGFRRASMAQVARAADISRQGLYLHFATKEELFRASVEYIFDSLLKAASDALEREATIESKLVCAFDESLGLTAGVPREELADLETAAERLSGDLVRKRKETLLAMIAQAVVDSGLAAAYKGTGIGLHDLARTLQAVAAGLMHQSLSLEETRRHLTIAVRIICVPLRWPTTPENLRVARRFTKRRI